MRFFYVFYTWGRRFLHLWFRWLSWYVCNFLHVGFLVFD